jgi:hypothetical protein
MSTAGAFPRAPATSPAAHASGRFIATAFEHLMWTGWPTTPMVVVNWCGHRQEFVPWPEKDGYWTLVPVVEAAANRTAST